MAIDWLAVKRDYFAGHLSLRVIGEKHGCAHSTIANYASRHGWARDLPSRTRDGNRRRPLYDI
jgi:uncharacterized protein YjcR